MEKEKPLPLSRALNFAATGFMHCASTVHDRIIQNNIPREHVIWIGMQQNIGQAFEGAMKCYLASKGATENELFRGRLRERAKSYAKALANDILR